MSIARVAATVSRSAAMNSKPVWAFRAHQRQRQLATAPATIQDNSNRNCQRRPALFCIPILSITNQHRWEICGTIGMFQVSIIRWCFFHLNINYVSQTVPVSSWAEEVSIPHISTSELCVCFSHANIGTRLKNTVKKRDDKEDRVDNTSALFKMAGVKVKFRT